MGLLCSSCCKKEIHPNFIASAASVKSFQKNEVKLKAGDDFNQNKDNDTQFLSISDSIELNKGDLEDVQMEPEPFF